MSFLLSSIVASALLRAISVEPPAPAPATSPATAPVTAPAAAETSARPRKAERVTELVPADSLVMAQRGTIPIIISAPHGGVVRVPGSTERTKGVKVLDTNTSQLAILIAQRITDRLGERPTYVIAQFSRKDVDCNRAAAPSDDDEAFNNDAAKACYEAYHAALRMSVDECRERWKGRAILIDVHGQARMPEAIIRGTRNGASMEHLVKERGREVIIGEKSIFGRLAAKGYQVEPALDDSKESVFNGGYITEHYGSASPDGVNAIQLEFGRMRVESVEKAAKDVGDAVVDFYREYLQPRP
jgi:N-formylglutamate amidohydrolase